MRLSYAYVSAKFVKAARPRQLKSGYHKFAVQYKAIWEPKPHPRNMSWVCSHRWGKTESLKMRTLKRE